MKRKIIFGIFSAIIIILLPISTTAGPTDPFYDPDGPYEGGLDDLSDWIHLADGIAVLGIIGINQNEIKDFDEIWVLITWLISLGYFALISIFEFIEAFDIAEIHVDGC